jgi:hypothetical protein
MQLPEQLLRILKRHNNLHMDIEISFYRKLQSKKSLIVEPITISAISPQEITLPLGAQAKPNSN